MKFLKLKRPVNIIILIIADLALSELLIKLFDLRFMAGFLTFLLVAFFGILLCIIAFLFKNRIPFYVSLNALFLPALFYFMLSLNTRQWSKNLYETKRFSAGLYRYELDINEKANTYSICQARSHDFSALYRVLFGKVVRKGDTCFLISKNNNLKVCKDTMTGFPGASYKIVLYNE